MPTFFFAACDGGYLNTLAAGGGILEITLEPRYKARYLDFHHGMGGSIHQVRVTPDGRFLVASSANVGQIVVIPLNPNGLAFDKRWIINSFNGHIEGLGIPELGTDSTTAMFDFLDAEHIVTQYNRRLVRINLHSKRIDVLADLRQVNGYVTRMLHQVSVVAPYVVVSEVNRGGIIVYHLDNHGIFHMSDGYSGGHHLAYKNQEGEICVACPSFNFQSVDGHLQIDDNVLSIFNISRRQAKTYYYAWDQPNHFPIDMYKEADDDHLYISFAIPGSVCKINLKDGAIVKCMQKRPGALTRYISMGLDFLYWLLDYGTMLNRYDRTVFSLNQFAHAYKLGRLSGTRAGFFSMASESGREELYVCHRGLNRLFRMDKKTLEVTSSYTLPPRRLDTPLVGWLYRQFPYFWRCLGVHHGTLVTVSEETESTATGD